MRKKRVLTCLAILIALSMCVLTGCGAHQATPAEMGYTIQVTYDANGGVISSAAKRFMWAKPNSLLIPPGEKQNSSQNVEAPARTGYRFTGWYFGTEGVLDETRQWDFSKDRVSEDVTLYAGWEKKSSFVIRYYTTVTTETGETRDEPAFTAPYYLEEDGGELEEAAIAPPAWKGHTLFGYYMDEALSKPAVFPVKHTGGDENKQMVLYTKWLEKEYVLVRTAADMRYLASDKNYYLLNNIDFTGKTWTMPEVFNGTIEGNGHTISGITVDMTQMRGVAEYGLFGRLSSTAEILDVKISASFRLTVGLRGVSTNTGLLAGKIDKGCMLKDVEVTGSVTVEIDRGDVKDHAVGALAAVIAPEVDLSKCRFDGIDVTLQAKEDE